MKQHKHSIKIGCTTKCKLFYQRALRSAAHELGAEIEVMDLSLEDRIHWERVDAILIPGGPDINPCYYLASIEKDLREHTKKMDKYVHYSSQGKRRDAFEHGLLMEYFHNQGVKDLPILGICRGMQMLAVSQGIPLYVDIREELGISHPYIWLDKVEVKDKESLMSRLSEGKTLVGAKLQHQAIRTDYFFHHHERWPNVEITAFSHEDHLAEAIEFKDRPILGVQFHPEVSPGSRMTNIFKWFIQTAMERHRHQEHFERLYAS